MGVEMVWSIKKMIVLKVYKYKCFCLIINVLFLFKVLKILSYVKFRCDDKMCFFVF